MAEITRLEWSEQGVDTSIILTWNETTPYKTTKSLLEFTVTVYNTPTGYYRTLNSGNVTINGTQYNFTSGRVYNGTVLYHDSVEIEHNSDGSKSVVSSMSINLGGTIKSTGNITTALTKINVKANISLSTYALTNNSSNLVLTWTVQSGLTYKTRWSSSNGTTKSWATRTGGTFTWTLSDLLNAGLLVTSGGCTLTLELATYSGSTLIGTSSAQVTYYVMTNAPASIKESNGHYGAGFGVEAVLDRFTIGGDMEQYKGSLRDFSFIQKLIVVVPAGSSYTYTFTNSQALGLVLCRATNYGAFLQFVIPMYSTAYSTTLISSNMSSAQTSGTATFTYTNTRSSGDLNLEIFILEA